MSRKVVQRFLSFQIRRKSEGTSRRIDSSLPRIPFHFSSGRHRLLASRNDGRPGCMTSLLRTLICDSNRSSGDVQTVGVTEIVFRIIVIVHVPPFLGGMQSLFEHFLIRSYIQSSTLKRNDMLFIDATNTRLFQSPSIAVTLTCRTINNACR